MHLTLEMSRWINNQKHAKRRTIQHIRFAAAGDKHSAKWHSEVRTRLHKHRAAVAWSSFKSSNPMNTCKIQRTGCVRLMDASPTQCKHLDYRSQSLDLGEPWTKTISTLRAQNTFIAYYIAIITPSSSHTRTRIDHNQSNVHTHTRTHCVNYITRPDRSDCVWFMERSCRALDVRFLNMIPDVYAGQIEVRMCSFVRPTLSHFCVQPIERTTVRHTKTTAHCCKCFTFKS